MKFDSEFTIISKYYIDDILVSLLVKDCNDSFIELWSGFSGKVQEQLRHVKAGDKKTISCIAKEPIYVTRTYGGLLKPFKKISFCHIIDIVVEDVTPSKEIAKLLLNGLSDISEEERINYIAHFDKILAKHKVTISLKNLLENKKLIKNKKNIIKALNIAKEYNFKNASIIFNAINDN